MFASQIVSQLHTLADVVCNTATRKAVYRRREDKENKIKYTRYCPSTINRDTHPHLSAVSKCWQTEDGEYDILFDEVGGFKHLRIQRIDNQPIHNFMDMQEIKNDLWGEDVVAVEVYPKQSDFKNGSNTYHLWTWNDIMVPNLAQLYKYKTEDAPQDIKESVAVQQLTAQACKPQTNAASTL